MKRQRFFHEYEQIYSRATTHSGKKMVFNRDFSRKPFCPCGEDYLSFVRDTFPDLLDDPRPQELEQAILVMTRHYAYQKKFVKTHSLHFCLPDVFDELLTLVTDKLDELHRMPKQSEVAELHIGVADEENAE